MKLIISILMTIQFLFISSQLFPQSGDISKELGVSVGEFTNFPCNKNYRKDDMTVFYVSPYVRAGRHEFSAGIVYELKYDALNFSDHKLAPCSGAIAGYKFYIFKPDGIENLFIHYAFQYLRFRDNLDITFSDGSTQPWTEKDTYINNVIGLGYNVYFDSNERFGFFYTLDYVISQTGDQLAGPGYTNNSWTTRYVWNNLSTHLGFTFKLTPLKKKAPK
ncbi:MAG: hypothetical protein ABSD71_11380 [Bacteroidales bacterium]|jgi:hypothetical protein